MSTIAKFAKENNLVALERYIARNTKLMIENLINTQDSDGYAALDWACYHGNTQMVTLLLQKGARASLVGSDGKNALHWCCYANNTTNLTTIIPLVPDMIDAKDLSGSTALHLACENNLYDIVRCLLQNCADGSVKNAAGQTVYDLAVSSGCDVNIINIVHHYTRQYYDTIEALEGGLVNITDAEALALLKKFSNRGENALAKMLLLNLIERNALPEDILVYIWNWIIKADDIELATKIIDKGFCLDLFLEQNDTTPLLWACSRDHGALVQKMLTAPLNAAHPDIHNIKSIEYLYRLQPYNMMDMMLLLLEYGANPNTIVDLSYRMTILHFAVEYGQVNIVKKLLELNVDEAMRDCALRTALDYAEDMRDVSESHLEILRMLSDCVSDEATSVHSECCDELYDTLVIGEM